jgi:quercetin dioxygenase-like cupin family protein
MDRDREKPTILGPNEGVRYEARGSEMVFKALATSGGGRFSLMERTLPAGGRMPPPHRHIDCDEAYFVLDGDVSFVLEGETNVRSAGTWVFVPGGVGHTFGNRSDSAAKLLVLHSPPLDGYFADLHELWHRPSPPSTLEELDLMHRHGMEPA